MKEQKLTPQAQDGVLAPGNHKKKVYSRPVLNIYGSVCMLTMGTASVGNDPSPYNNTRKNSQSDRTAKENIVRIGQHPLGIGLYLFDYKPEYRNQWGNGRQFGVMADEVEKVMPEAVSVHPDGYKMVNYALLGISRNLH